jgi:two-component system nitrate/nitrite response regulator NarL
MNTSTPTITRAPAQQLAAKPPIRVMLIDDHPTLLWGLEKLINAEMPRMNVMATARNAGEALSCLERETPDVVLLDLDLDGQSGLTLLPALLRQPGTRVLILTGERQQNILDQAVQKGARGILRKDASAEHVLKAIEKTHEGELWLDRSTLGRVFTEFRDPASAPKPDPKTLLHASLTVRERRIIALVVQSQGASNKAMAQSLFISEHTLRNHLSSVYQKLDVANRLELYVYATRYQLGTPEADAAA